MLRKGGIHSCRPCKNMVQGIIFVSSVTSTHKTRNRIREDTVLMNFPLYCPKCKQETLIEVKDLQLLVIKEPDAQPQSR